MNAVQTLNNMFGYITPSFVRIEHYNPSNQQVTAPVKPAKPVKEPDALKASERRILQIVNCNNGVTGIRVAEKTGWTSNHCSMILTTLFKRGLIKRVKRTAPNIRFYEYFKSDSA